MRNSEIVPQGPGLSHRHDDGLGGLCAGAPQHAGRRRLHRRRQEFKDPKTGQVWTPETVGQDGKPLKPDDKAFDPKAQTVPTQFVEQRLRGMPVGMVPITAGPTVPIVAIDNASLRAVPGQRWQAVLYLDNNSGSPVDPVIECGFTNGGNLVMNTRAVVQQTGPGVRQGLVIYGPRTDAFVDRVSCRVASP